MKKTTCQWFLKCRNQANKQVAHPTLGWVDCCDDHIAWLGEHPTRPQFVPPIVARHAEELKKKLDG